MNHTWTRNKKTGKWNILAVGDHWKEGDTLTVYKKDGSSQEVVAGRCSKPFEGKYGPTAGQMCQFITPARRDGGSGGNGGGRYTCDDCGDVVVPGSSCWETGLQH